MFFLLLFIVCYVFAIDGILCCRHHHRSYCLQHKKAEITEKYLMKYLVWKSELFSLRFLPLKAIFFIPAIVVVVVVYCCSFVSLVLKKQKSQCSASVGALR